MRYLFFETIEHVYLGVTMFVCVCLGLHYNKYDSRACDDNMDSLSVCYRSAWRGVCGWV